MIINTKNNWMTWNWLVRYKDRLTSNEEVNEGSYKSMRIHEPVWFKIDDDDEFIQVSRNS